MRLPVLLLLTLGILSGCGGTTVPPAASSDPIGIPFPPGAGPPGDWTAGIVTQPASLGYPADLVAVRSARHRGFDRVVLEFRDALPGWHLEYIDHPVRQCGSGRPMELAGEGWLEVRLSPARAHDQSGQPLVVRRHRRPNLPVVRELALSCDFEGVVTWVLGVRSPNRYRITPLDDPPRLVVDVRH